MESNDAIHTARLLEEDYFSQTVDRRDSKWNLPVDVTVLGSKKCMDGESRSYMFGTSNVFFSEDFQLSIYACADFEWNGKSFPSVAHALASQRVVAKCEHMFTSGGLLADIDLAADEMIPVTQCEDTDLEQLRKWRDEYKNQRKSSKFKKAPGEWRRKYGRVVSRLEHRIADAEAQKEGRVLNACRPLACRDKMEHFRARFKRNIHPSARRVGRIGVLGALALRKDVSKLLGIQLRTKAERGEQATRDGEARLLADILHAKCRHLPDFAARLRESRGYLVQSPHEEILSPAEPDEDLSRAALWTAYITRDGMVLGKNLAGEVLMHVREGLRSD